MKDLIATLLAAAFQLGAPQPPAGHVLPPVQVEIVSPERLQELACPGSKCPMILAITLDKTSEIKVSDKVDLTSTFGKSLLLHELVHFLQNQLRPLSTNCYDYVNDETEAYMVQARWLQAQGQPMDFRYNIMAMRRMCARQHPEGIK